MLTLVIQVRAEVTPTSIERTKRQTQQTVIILVHGKLPADILGGLNGLSMRGDTTDTDGILVDVTASPAAITVGDLPAVSFQLSRVGSWLVDAVTTPFRSGKFLREDPTSLLVRMSINITYPCLFLFFIERLVGGLQIRGSRVNIQVQCRVTNLDRGEIFLVILLRLGNGTAIVSSSLDALGHSLAKLRKRIGVYSWQVNGSALGVWLGELSE